MLLYFQIVFQNIIIKGIKYIANTKASPEVSVISNAERSKQVLTVLTNHNVSYLK